jgi:hypothetical protein
MNIDLRKNEAWPYHTATVSLTLNDCPAGYSQCRTRRETDRDNENH